MSKRFLNYGLFFSLIGIAFLSSCGVTKEYSKPEMNIDSLYRDIQDTDTNSIAYLVWEDVFTDPLLQALIKTGLANNPDLEIAYLNIQQAEAYFNQSKAAFLPNLNLNAGIDESRLPEAQRFGRGSNITQYNITVSSAWEADIWGKLKSSKKAELANLLATTEAAKAVKTRLIATIANYYYQLLAMDEQLAITEKTIINWDSTVETMRALKEAATVTEAAVVQSEAQRYAAEVTIPDLKQAIRETENALSILIGSQPNAIDRGHLGQQLLPMSLNTGISSQLLANRPDVLQAELQFRQQFELANMARTYFYPSISITGSAGFNTTDISNLLDPASFVASIGAGLAQPIFNKRLNKTRLEVALLQQKTALLNFKTALLEAGREVSDALSLYETANQKIVVRQKQKDALEKAVDYSQELLENGFANYTEVITARQSLLQAELGGVNDRLERLISVVNLYRSLGGGSK